MAKLLTVRLTRNDTSTPWGFRLQGGKDFGTPLLIQKVNMGSLAEKAGLQVGDAVLRVNGKEVAELRHKDAQDTIVRAGNTFEVAIQRGGNTVWKPSVTPVGSVPSPNPYSTPSPSPVTKTSLAATNRQSPRIPSGFNTPTKPYSPQQNGGYANENGSIKAIVNKQYNTPVGIYSDESIAETLSAQAEVLAGGVLGVNFKKNEKNYNAESSEVFKLVKEADKEPRSPEPDAHQNGTATPPISGLRHVSAPQPKAPSSPTSLSPGQNICADCERLIVPSSVTFFATSSHAIGGRATSPRPRTPISSMLPPRSRTNSPLPIPKPTALQPTLTEVTNCTECRQNIVGVFVRIKDKNLHVECFKCATCGTSLKNVGYYTINNKLYCDIHAKMIAKQNPPAANLDPITIPPSQFSASKVISSALSNTSSPAPTSPLPTLAPVPFHPPRLSPTHVSAPQPQQSYSSLNGTKPFNPVNKFSNTFSGPKSDSNLNPVTKSVPTDSHISYYNPSQNRLPFLKPKSDKSSSAFVPVLSQKNVETFGQNTSKELFQQLDTKQFETSLKKRLSVNSQEIEKVLRDNAVRTIGTANDRPESTIPSDSADEFMEYERNMERKNYETFQSIARPHSVRSLSPCERPLTPNQVVVFPPEMPAHLKRGRSRTPTPSLVYTSEEGITTLEPVKVEVFRSSREFDVPCDDYSCSIEQTKETIKVTCKSPIIFEQRKSSERECTTIIEEIFDEKSDEQESKEQKSSQFVGMKQERQPYQFTEQPDEERSTLFLEESDQQMTSEHITTSSEQSKKHIEESNEQRCSRVVKDTGHKNLIRIEDTEEDKSVNEKINSKCDLTSLQDLPRSLHSKGNIASAVTIAPDRPFTPVEPVNAIIQTEPVPLPPETRPYCPDTSDRCESPFVQALTTASDRVYSPLPTETIIEIKSPEPLPERKRPNLTDALAIAPTRSYSPFYSPYHEPSPIPEPEPEPAKPPRIPDLNEDPSIILKRPIIQVTPKVEPKKFASGTRSSFITSSSTETSSTISDELKTKFEEKTRTGLYSKKAQQERKCELEKPPTPKPPFTSTGLHKPLNLPQYQQCVKELAARSKASSTRSTPTPRVDSRKTTPTNFEATVSTQQKVFHTNLTSELEKAGYIKDMPPVLGYEPNSVYKMEMQKYSSVCVKTSSMEVTKSVNRTSTLTPESKQSVTLSSDSSVLENSEKTSTEIKSGSCSSTGTVNKNTSFDNAEKTSSEEIIKPVYRSSTSVPETKQSSSSLTDISFGNSVKTGSTEIFKSVNCFGQSTKPVNHSETSTPETKQCCGNTMKTCSTDCSSFNDCSGNTVKTCSDTIKSVNRSLTSTPDIKLSPLVISADSTFTVTPSGAQCFKPSFSPVPKPATTPLTRLSKTLSTLTAKCQKSNVCSKPSPDPIGTGKGTNAGFSAPRRGRGVLNPQNSSPGARIPLCAQCSSQIRGPFVTALGKIWCPDHFVCVNNKCRRSLMDIGFVEEPSGLYCEYCFEQFLAPTCSSCSKKIKGDCLNAIGKHFHPECFTCAYCGKLFGNNPFFLEDGLPYCENDWNELFTTKCIACGFPIEAGDRWVEALNNNYHSPCFNCTMCKTNLEGQSFYAKGGRPYCKNHAR